MRGRKPVPDVVKRIRGTDQPCRMNPNQPDAGIEGLQFIPDELSEQARPYWSQLRTKLVESGIANNLDREALVMLCESWATLMEATEKVREGGLVVMGRHNYPVRSPYLPIMHKAQEQISRLLVEFGMTPSSRQRISVADVEQEASSVSGFFD